jgi:hypothetical protein
MNWQTPTTPTAETWKAAALRLWRSIMTVEDMNNDLTPETLRACDHILTLAGADAVARGEVQQARDADAWKAVAVALHAELVGRGYDPRSCAVQAYNHARNGRHLEALEVLS